MVGYLYAMMLGFAIIEHTGIRSKIQVGYITVPMMCFGILNGRLSCYTCDLIDKTQRAFIILKSFQDSINQFIELHWQVLITKYLHAFFFFFDKILFNGQWLRNPFVPLNGSCVSEFILWLVDKFVHFYTY